MLYVPARHWYKGRRRPIRLVVIHCTVSKEWGTGAEAVAAYFAAGTRRASAHRVVDSNSVVMSVRDEDTAYGAAGANADGLHLELIGMPDQTTDQWLDDFGRSMLHLAAGEVRRWCGLYGIERRWLTIDEVADGVTAGLCTHHDVSLAFPTISTGHWDPGPEFPRDHFLRLVGGVSVPPPPAPLEADVARIIQHPNGSQALVGPGAAMTVLHTTTETEALVADGSAQADVIVLPNPLIWDTRKAVAERAGVYTP